MGEHSNENSDGVADVAEVEALMPPDIPEDEMTVAVCGTEED